MAPQTSVGRAAPAEWLVQYDPDEREERLDLRIDGHDVAYATLIHRDHDVWLLELGVHPDWRGQGHASAVIREILARHNEREIALSCEPCSLWNWGAAEGLTRSALAAWYTRHGFVATYDTFMRRLASA